MKVILALVVLCFATVSCKELLSSIDTGSSCTEDIEEAIAAALYIDDHFGSNLADNLIDDINNDCKNILDVLAPIMEYYPKSVKSFFKSIDKGDQVLAIVLNSETKKVISISGTLTGDNRIFGIKGDNDPMTQIIYIVATWIKGEHWYQLVGDYKLKGYTFDSEAIPEKHLTFEGFKPSCNDDEVIYCNFNCESLTCDNHVTYTTNYEQCVSDSSKILFCLLGTWSDCKCALGLVKDTKTGWCIQREECPIAPTTEKLKTPKVTTAKAPVTTPKAPVVTTVVAPTSSSK